MTNWKEFSMKDLRHETMVPRSASQRLMSALARKTLWSHRIQKKYNSECWLKRFVDRA